jgi:hypothetical protein
LQRDRDRFAAAGGDVVTVGLGAPADAAQFKAESGIPFPLLVSPDKAAYRAMDLKRGSLREVLLGLRVIKAGRRARGNGATWRRPKQDWHQLGGAFVIAPGGRLVWSHRAAHSGDNPPHEPMLAAIRQAASA